MSKKNSKRTHVHYEVRWTHSDPDTALGTVYHSEALAREVVRTANVLSGSGIYRLVKVIEKDLT